MTEWFHEHFAPGPGFGWLCLVILIGIVVVWVRWRSDRARPTVRYSSLASADKWPMSWASRTRFVPPLLRSLAIVALIIALARPQAGGEYSATREGIAVQMVLDVSGSMSEKDFVMDGQPVRRLDAVKKVFKDFVLGKDGLPGRENDLIGMTSFAMYADTTCPLTLDHGSLVDLLDETDIPGWINGRQLREDQEAGFTALGDAIVQAADDLRRAGEQAVAGVPGAEPAKSRILILLTDGKDNPADIRGIDPPDPVEAAKVAARLGIKIYTIGAIGSAGVQRRNALNMFFQPTAAVDEPTLKEIASLTGGQYFRATDTDSLANIYEEIDKLETHRTGDRSYRDDVWAAQMAMFLGLGLLMMELLLVNTRYRRVP